MKTQLHQHKKMIVVGIVFLVFSILLYWRYSVLHLGTDDAYVEANIVNVAPQISGQVNAIYVQNHQVVKKNELLFSIDSAPFIIALQQAQAKLEATKQKIAADQDAVNVGKSVLEQRTAEYQNVQVDSLRAIKLAAQGVLSRQDADDATTKIATSLAALHTAQAQLKQAQDTLAGLGDQNAYFKQAEAGVAQAQLNLSYTKVLASADGNIENFTLHTGDIVTINTPVFGIIDETQWWVSANYNENDLERIHVGQAARVQMDMYSGHVFKGVVESIGRSSGATFSLLPSENATGNWVKVTQRFPVRIHLIHVDTKYPPRVGASAVVTINASYR